jgi:hypothetical protein
MTPVRRIFAEKRTLVVPLAAALAVNLALFALMVYPLETRVSRAEARASAAAASLLAAERDALAARATIDGRQRADEDLQRFYEEVLPADLTGARRITYLRLAQIAERANLRPGRRAIDEPRQPRESPVRKLRTTMALAGEYRDIRRFIHQVETAPEFLVIEDISLAQPADRGEGLVLSVEVSTYYWAGLDERR